MNRVFHYGLFFLNFIYEDFNSTAFIAFLLLTYILNFKFFRDFFFNIMCFYVNMPLQPLEQKYTRPNTYTDYV